MNRDSRRRPHGVRWAQGTVVCRACGEWHVAVWPVYAPGDFFRVQECPKCSLVAAYWEEPDGNP